jgi:hypothetical protein
MVGRSWFTGMAAATLLVAFVVGGPLPGAEAATAGAERTLATNQNPNYSVDVAFDGTNYLVVWTRSAVSFADVLGARVRPDGTVLDPNGFLIAGGTNQQSRPAVAFDGTQYLVVWEDYRTGSADIYGARVSTGGAVLDPAGIPFSTTATDQLMPAVAFHGTMALVTWADFRSGSSYDIYGTRWTSGGGVFDPTGMQISAVAGHQYDPAVSWAGEHFLVVWTDDRAGADATDVYGARVATTGGAVDTIAAPFSTAPGNQGSPDLAFDGTNVLVVWNDRRSGTTYDIYGTRWSPTSGVLNPAGVPLSTAVKDQFNPVVDFNGQYLVVWSDYREAATAADLYGTRVTTAGAVSDPSGFVVSAGSASELFRGVTAGSGDTWATGYARTDGGVYFRTVRPK